MTPKEIIEELFRARVSNRITQDELGEKAGYDRSQIWRTETGNHNTRMQLVCDVAEALGYELRLVKK